MRHLMTLVVFAALSIALIRSRPVDEVAESAPLVVEAQPAAVEVDGDFRQEPDPGMRLNSPLPDLYTVPPPDASRLPELHQQNDVSFRQASGFGRTRSGAHVLMDGGEVKYITESIVADDTQLVPNGNATNGPYGLWGRLGTRSSPQKPKSDTDHSFQKLSVQHVSDHDVDSWRVEFIQLVSIDHSWAYEDDELPTMETLADASIGTRPLNEFELKCIDKLSDGEQVVIDRSDHVIKMVGAIRASSKCLQCHAAEEGDLLGAFTYRFKPSR